MDKFIVTSSPHYRSDESIRSVMGDVIIALLPALAVGVVFFGFRVLTLAAVSVGACIAFESLFNIIRKKKNTASDFSCVVTGLLLVMCLPVTAPYWMVVVGDFFAIVVVKMLFGGIGKNFFNPALAARAFLFSWPAIMTKFIVPFKSSVIPVFGAVPEEVVDAVSSATPLTFLKTGTLPDVSIADLFFGNVGGCIGEVSAAALLLGGFYLLFRKIITWHIPVCYIGTVALVTFIFPASGGFFNLDFMLAELLSGGLLLGAFFMATDYTTSPITSKGRIIYGIGCGLLTVFLRYFGGYPEGVSYAILLMNVFAFALDKIARPRRYGAGGEI